MFRDISRFWDAWWISRSLKKRVGVSSLGKVSSVFWPRNKRPDPQGQRTLGIFEQERIESLLRHTSRPWDVGMPDKKFRRGRKPYFWKVSEKIAVAKSGKRNDIAKI